MQGKWWGKMNCFSNGIHLSCIFFILFIFYIDELSNAFHQWIFWDVWQKLRMALPFLGRSLDVRNIESHPAYYLWLWIFVVFFQNQETGTLPYFSKLMWNILWKVDSWECMCWARALLHGACWLVVHANYDTINDDDDNDDEVFVSGVHML